MKNSVHDNGGFIGRVADYAAEDYYQTSGVYSAYSFTFDNITFGVGSQASEPRGLFFKPDGTMIFIVDNGGDNVYSYSLTTAWDLSTASYTGDSFSVSSQTSRASDIYFKPDGTKLYVSGQLINGLSEYSLSTAWDITTASFSSGTGEFSEGVGVMGLTFKPDGTQFYVSNFHNDYVHVYSMTTAWDISTHSFSGDEFSLLSQVGSPTDIAFNSDGTVMYAVGESNYFASWDLSTAYDVTTATFNSRFAVTSKTRGISFKSDYSKLYLVEYTNDTVRQYSASSSTGNGNKKNTGVWSMDADYLNAELDVTAIFSTAKVHVDADDINSYSGTGTTWSDLSGNGYDLTMSSSGVYSSTGVKHMAFQNSSDTAVYSGSGDIPISQTNGVTYVVATRPLSGTPSWKTMTRGNNSDHHVIIQNGVNIGMWDGGFKDSGIDQSNLPSHTNNDWILMYFRWANGQGYKFSYNDTPSTIRGTLATNASAQYNSGGFRALGNYQGNGQPWGDIALFAAWETELTDAQLTAIYNTYQTRFSLP